MPQHQQEGVVHPFSDRHHAFTDDFSFFQIGLEVAVVHDDDHEENNSISFLFPI